MRFQNLHEEEKKKIKLEVKDTIETHPAQIEKDEEDMVIKVITNTVEMITIIQTKKKKRKPKREHHN
jgi:TRAP-type C4-dicarboxylate transport system substrate-binding protein